MTYSKYCLLPFKNVLVCGLCLFLLIFVGCSISRSMIVNDRKVIMQGLYEVDSPSLNWQSSTKDAFNMGDNSKTKHDVVFASCPGPKLIVISRAVYRPDVFKKKWTKEIDSNSFENIALCYLDDFYHGQKIRKLIFSYEIVSYRNIHIGYYNAVEAICKTKEIFKNCEGEEKEKELMHKFILIEGGDSSAFPGWGLNSPRMIVFWYGSPVENYEEGLAEFDKMVQSFRFIKN